MKVKIKFHKYYLKDKSIKLILIKIKYKHKITNYNLSTFYNRYIPQGKTIERIFEDELEFNELTRMRIVEEILKGFYKQTNMLKIYQQVPKSFCFHCEIILKNSIFCTGPLRFCSRLRLV